MMGDKIRRKIEELKAVRKAREYILEFQEHRKRTYPYTKEDDEGTMTFLSSRCVELTFKGLTLEEGYNKTVNKFKLLGRIHKTRITLENDKVVVVF